MRNWRPRRSVLYVPAANIKAIEKAGTLPCDCIILDLEDSIAPEQKDAAREQMVSAVKSGRLGQHEVVVRINPPESPWGKEDVQAALACSPDGVLIPKVSIAADVLRCAEVLGSTGPDIWAMIETARSAAKLDEIASMSTHSRLAALVVGTNDFAKETGAILGNARMPILSFLGLAVAAAKSYGLSIIDGVFNDIDDLDAFGAQCQQGLEFGFDGKTLIHPKQIALCNKTFSPSPARLEWANEVCTAFELPENRDKGVIRLSGKMVERLHFAQAQRLLETQRWIAGEA